LNCKSFHILALVSVPEEFAEFFVPYRATTVDTTFLKSMFAALLINYIFFLTSLILLMKEI